MVASMIVAEPEASLTPTKSPFEDDLVHCGTCHKLLQDPKTLSCLHSFCLKCLQKQLESTGKEATSLHCPTCNSETKLAPGGVVDLGVIAFVSRQRNEIMMREKLNDTDTKIMCTNCEGSSIESSAEAITRCFECDDYLCESCTKMHKTFKLLRHHPLFTLDELRSGKVPLSLQDQSTCQKHKGETLVFYCETCDIPICSKCAIVAHRHPEHKQAELDSAAAERSQKIMELEREARQVAPKIDELIESNEKLLQKLNTTISEANAELDNAKESTRKQMLDVLEKAYTNSKDKLKEHETKNASILKHNLDELRVSRSRLQITRMVANQVTEKGSEFEIAAVYGSVTSSLTELNGLGFEHPLEAKLGEVKSTLVKPSLPVMDDLIRFGLPLLEMNKVQEFGKLVNGRGIVCTDTGSYLAANFTERGEYYYHLYSGKGELSSKIDTGYHITGGGKSSSPWCVVVHPNGHIFGTGNTQHIKQYREDGKYINRYSTMSPDGVASDADNSIVQGLALDKDGNLIAGNVTKKYVSIIKPDGTRVTNLYVPIKPWFICATPTDNIIISSYEEKAVHVMDGTGKVLVTFNPPDGVGNAKWKPTGVCCSEDGDVFIANNQGRVGVYQYDLKDGEYVGCNTEDVTQPWGIALSKDEKKLAVADNTRVKIFEILKH